MDFSGLADCSSVTYIEIVAHPRNRVSVLFSTCASVDPAMHHSRGSDLSSARTLSQKQKHDRVEDRLHFLTAFRRKKDRYRR